MDDRLSRLEASIRDLDRRLRVLEEAEFATDLPPAPEIASASTTRLAERETAAEVIALTGRTLVTLGGAYLLRALSDSHLLPLTTGVILAFVYAGFWLLAADRDGGRGRATSAAFHGLVACMVAFPLIWEATSRFLIIGTTMSAVALTAVSLATIAVAVHRRVQAIAWLAIVLMLPTAVVLMVSTGDAIALTTSLIVIGVTTLWVGYSWDWTWLRWPVALFADVAVLALAVRAAGGGAQGIAGLDPIRIVAVQMLLLNAYLGSVALRTIVRARDVIVFEVVQTGAALAVGFGGAVYVAQHSGAGVEVLALLNLLFGSSCYAVAFFFVRERPRNFYFYSTLALVLLIAGAWLLLPAVWLTVTFDLLAMASMWTAARVGRVALTAHASIYLAAASIASALLSFSVGALAAPVATAWAPATWPALLTLLVLGICWWWPMPGRAGLLPHEWAPRVVIAILLAVSGAGCAVAAVTPLLAGTPGQGADAGVVATIRTAALAAAAILLGRFGRDSRFRESLWLLYPVLAAGGVKLLIEDFPQSRPATLFLALALYGGALIAAPRLAKTALRN